jgi:hypothetical protein
MSFLCRFATFDADRSFLPVKITSHSVDVPGHVVLGLRAVCMSWSDSK